LVVAVACTLPVVRELRDSRRLVVTVEDKLSVERELIRYFVVERPLLWWLRSRFAMTQKSQVTAGERVMIQE
jgi:hypothetical protein